jgi:hypothetical protein
MKHSLRSKTTGRFVSRSNSATNIVNGRLYEYRGAIVRAKRRCNNGLRFVSFHKKLNGFVQDYELKPISVERVRAYLENA